MKTGQSVGEECDPLAEEGRFEARPKKAPSSSSEGGTVRFSTTT